MKVCSALFLAAVGLVFIVDLVASGRKCTIDRQCGAGKCCVPSSDGNGCQSFGGLDAPCERYGGYYGNANTHSTACKCQEGLYCDARNNTCRPLCNQNSDCGDQRCCIFKGYCVDYNKRGDKCGFRADAYHCAECECGTICTVNEQHCRNPDDIFSLLSK